MRTHLIVHLLEKPSQRRWPRQVAYLSTAAITLVVVWARHLGDPIYTSRAPFLPFIAAIVLSSWLFGGELGVFSTLLSVLCVAALSPQPETLLDGGVRGMVRLVTFVAEGLMVSGLTQLHRRSQRQIRQTLDRITDGFFALDREWRVTYINARSEVLLQRSRGDLLGWSLWDAFPEAVGSEFQRQYARAMDTQEPVSFDAFYPPLGAWFDVRAYPSPEGLSVYFRDITEQRQTEEMLREVVRNATCILWESRIEYPVDVPAGFAWEQTVLDTGAAQSILPLDTAAHGSYVEAWGAAIHPEDRARLDEAAYRYLTPGDHHYEQEFRCTDRTGKLHWIREQITMHAVGEGRWQAYGVATDITEHKQSEAALQEAHCRKDEFLAMLAHELRNPLGAITSGIHLLDRIASQEPEPTRVRGVLRRQAEHLARLVDDLLDVSRITRGTVDLRKEQIDLAVAVARAVETARPLIEARRHRLTVSLPDEPIALEADPTRLEQMVTNLLGNAAKFTDPGGQIGLTVGREGDGAVIVVTDTGRGIAAEVLPGIFELFAQAEPSLDRSQGGLGIGLTLVRSLARMHGGDVAASSPGPGAGSTFDLRLPALPRRGAEEGAAATVDAPPASESFRVLVVDDNQDAAGLLSDLLALWKHQVRVAFDGPSAIEVARAFRPQVALLDLGLPIVTGYEVARTLREQPGAAPLLLVAVTGYGQEEDRQRSRAAGFDRHLVKPIDLDSLRNHLVEWYSEKGPRQAP